MIQSPLLILTGIYLRHNPDMIAARSGYGQARAVRAQLVRARRPDIARIWLQYLTWWKEDHHGTAHGTHAAYRNGCRCTDCTELHTLCLINRKGNPNNDGENGHSMDG